MDMNRRLLWGFAGVMAAVMVMLMDIWQLGLIALLGIIGYIIGGLRLGERWRAFLRRRD